MVRAGGIVLLAVREFFRDRGPMYSAALSYLFMLEIVPLCLFFVGVWGFVLGADDELFRLALDRLMGVFPTVTSAMTQELEKLVTHRDVAITSLVLYAVLSYQLYWGLGLAMTAIFKTKPSKKMVHFILKPLILVSVVLLTLLVSFLLPALVPLVVRHSPFEIQLGAKATVLLGYVVPFLIMMSAAFIVYKLVPPLKVRIKDALWGSHFTAIMIEAAKHTFTWFVGSVARMGTMYGSLAAFVTFLLWMYFSWAIFLVGAEIVHLLGESRPERGNIY